MDTPVNPIVPALDQDALFEAMFASIRVPTEAEMTAQAVKTMPLVQPYFLDQMPDDVRSVAIPMVMILLDDATAPALLRVVRASMGDTVDLASDEHRIAIEQLSVAITKAIAEVGGEAFIRLNTRSPKDIAGRYPVTTDVIDVLGQELRQPIVTTAEQALDNLSGSERIFLDLQDLVYAKLPAYVVVRPYLRALRNDCEFRVFVFDNHIGGITQMFCQPEDASPAIVAQADRIEQAIRGFWSEHLARPLSQLSDYTLDLAVLDGHVLLVEINPPANRFSVYPGLFRDGVFDGGFRILPLSA